jgi:hypothetical protein
MVLYNTSWYDDTIETNHTSKPWKYPGLELKPKSNLSYYVESSLGSVADLKSFSKPRRPT